MRKANELPSVLETIAAEKRREVAARRAMLGELPAAGAGATRDFAGALRGDRVRLIAEVKKASPSRGILREDFDPLALAATYAENGAAAISVLTDSTFFRGAPKHLTDVREK